MFTAPSTSLGVTPNISNLTYEPSFRHNKSTDGNPPNTTSRMYHPVPLTTRHSCIHLDIAGSTLFHMDSDDEALPSLSIICQCPIAFSSTQQKCGQPIIHPFRNLSAFPSPIYFPFCGYSIHYVHIDHQPANKQLKICWSGGMPCLDLHLYIVNGIRQLNLWNDGSARQHLDEDLAYFHKDREWGGAKTHSGCCNPKVCSCASRCCLITLHAHGICPRDWRGAISS